MTHRTSLAKSLNCDGRHGRDLLVSVLALVLPGFGAAWERAYFSYERAGLSGGEAWRWVTAHLIHLDLDHAVLNAVGFVLVWALFRDGWRTGEWLVILATSVAAVDLGLWFLSPEVAWYVGASGVLHGLMAAGVIAQWRSEKLIAGIVGALLAAKLWWEARGGALPFSDSGVVVVVAAHLYGAIGGALAALTLAVRRMAIMRRFGF